MRQGARTPEELETLLEDAYVLRDHKALSRLFEDDAVLEDDGLRARGSGEIASHATAMWDREQTYVADPRRVLQARDTALVVAVGGISVVRRGSDGAWRYVISLRSETEER
jgi:ketosteroid isomerase-like protein